MVAVGLDPNTQLAESARLETDTEWGGYRVNSELQACTDIWAVSRDFVVPLLPSPSPAPSFPLLISHYLATSPLLSSPPPPPPLLLPSPLLSLPSSYLNRLEMCLATLTPTLVGGEWNIMITPMSVGNWLEKT